MSTLYLLVRDTDDRCEPEYLGFTEMDNARHEMQVQFENASVELEDPDSYCLWDCAGCGHHYWQITQVEVDK